MAPSKEERGGAEINDTETGFNKEGTEEEKKKNGGGGGGCFPKLF